MNKDRSKKSIVLVEDEKVIANLLTKKLTQAGYEVQTATDGVSGLELIQKVKPKLVLLDMGLPALSGFDILEQLKATNLLPKLPVIIISNSGQQIEIERAVKLGNRDYLVKINLDLDELMRKVDTVLSSDGKVPDTNGGAMLGNVLIVEDDTFLLSLLEKKFKLAEIQSYSAMDVNEARSVMQNKKIDVILLDIVLPGESGITFLREIKADKKWKSIPVIITSNLGQSEEIQSGLEAGATEYFVKANVTPDEIITKVRKFIK